MKKAITILTFWTLIFAGFLQGTSFAMDSIPEEVLTAEKQKCYSVLPTLTENLKVWRENYNQYSQFQDHLKAGQFEEVAKCLESAKKMDELKSDIFDQSKILFGSMGNLQTNYPNMAKQIMNLLGVEEGLEAIKENFCLFAENAQKNMPSNFTLTDK